MKSYDHVLNATVINCKTNIFSLNKTCSHGAKPKQDRAASFTMQTGLSLWSVNDKRTKKMTEPKFSPWFLFMQTALGKLQWTLMHANSNNSDPVQAEQVPIPFMQVNTTISWPPRTSATPARVWVIAALPILAEVIALCAISHGCESKALSIVQGLFVLCFN